MKDPVSGRPEFVSSASDKSRTHGSLLSGLREVGTDRFQSSWERFVDTYTPMIFSWCKQLGVARHQDAEDITQRLMCKLVSAMQEFCYDSNQSFRSWLRVSTRNAVYRFWRDEKAFATEQHADLTQLANQDQLVDRLEKEFDLEIESVAREQVQRQVSDRDWQVFEQVTESPKSPEEIATVFGISTDLVYKIKSRIVQSLTEAISQLEQHGL